jgi:hypothetical protein
MLHPLTDEQDAEAACRSAREHRAGLSFSEFGV